VERNNMSFYNFFSESLALSEASKFNAGDAMEGIFAIGVALYIADGKINKDKLNTIRKQVIISSKESFTQTIDSNIADDGWIANKLPHIQPGNKLAVKVIINLKATAKDAFGPKSKQIPDIENTIHQMVNQIANTSAIKRIEKFIVQILTNHTPDNVIFYVVADGSQTGQTGDQIKGDVMLRVEAKTNTPIPIDIEKSIKFSVKTDTSTTSGLGIFTGVLRIGNFFGLPFTKGLEKMTSFPRVGGSATNKVVDMIRTSYRTQSEDPNHLIFYVQRYINLQNKVYNFNPSDDIPNIDVAKQKVMEAGWVIIHRATEELENQLKVKDATYDFTTRTFNFLEKEIFGSDDAEVIRLLPGSISEISKEDFAVIKNRYITEFAVVGDDMKFIGVDKETNKRDLLFSLIPENRITPSETVFRFDVKLGPIFYKQVT